MPRRSHSSAAAAPVKTKRVATPYLVIAKILQQYTNVKKLADEQLLVLIRALFIEPLNHDKKEEDFKFDEITALYVIRHCTLFNFNRRIVKPDFRRLYAEVDKKVASVARDHADLFLQKPHVLARVVEEPVPAKEGPQQPITFVSKDGLAVPASPADANYPEHCQQTPEVNLKWTLDFTKVRCRGKGKPALWACVIFEAASTRILNAAVFFGNETFKSRDEKVWSYVTPTETNNSPSFPNKDELDVDWLCRGFKNAVKMYGRPQSVFVDSGHLFNMQRFKDMCSELNIQLFFVKHRLREQARERAHGTLKQFYKAGSRACPNLPDEEILANRAHAYNDHVIGSLKLSPNELGDRLNQIGEEGVPQSYIAHSASPTGNQVYGLKKAQWSMYRTNRKYQQADTVDELAREQKVVKQTLNQFRSELHQFRSEIKQSQAEAERRLQESKRESFGKWVLQGMAWFDVKWDSLENTIETAVSRYFQELASAQTPQAASVTQAPAATKAPAATQAPAAASASKTPAPAAASGPSAPGPVSKTAATRPSSPAKPVPAVKSSSALPSKKQKKFGRLSAETQRVIGLKGDVSVFQSTANTFITRKTLIGRVPQAWLMLLVADHTDWYSLRYITYEGVLALATTGATVFATDEGKVELHATEERRKAFLDLYYSNPDIILEKGTQLGKVYSGGEVRSKQSWSHRQNSPWYQVA